MNKKITSLFLSISLLFGQVAVCANDGQAQSKVARKDQVNERSEYLSRLYVGFSKRLAACENKKQTRQEEQKIYDELCDMKDAVQLDDAGEPELQLSEQEFMVLVANLKLTFPNVKDEIKRVLKEESRKKAYKKAMKFCMAGLITKKQFEKIVKELGLESWKLRLAKKLRPCGEYLGGAAAIFSCYLLGKTLLDSKDSLCLIFSEKTKDVPAGEKAEFIASLGKNIFSQAAGIIAGLVPLLINLDK